MFFTNILDKVGMDQCMRYWICVIQHSVIHNQPFARNIFRENLCRFAVVTYRL